MPKQATTRPLKLDSLEQVRADMEELARVQRRMEEITAKRDHDLTPHVMAIQPHQAKIDEITEEAATELAPLSEHFQLIEKRIVDSAMAMRRWQRWVNAAADKVKRLDFPTGGYISRQLSRSKRIKLSRTVEEIAAALEAAGHPEFVERTTKLKRNALKQNPDVVAAIDGLEIIQDVQVKVYPLG